MRIIANICMLRDSRTPILLNEIQLTSNSIKLRINHCILLYLLALYCTYCCETIKITKFVYLISIACVCCVRLYQSWSRVSNCYSFNWYLYVRLHSHSFFNRIVTSIWIWSVIFKYNQAINYALIKCIDAYVISRIQRYQL